jgi:hypothetical protein
MLAPWRINAWWAKCKGIQTYKDMKQREANYRKWKFGKKKQKAFVEEEEVFTVRADGFVNDQAKALYESMTGNQVLTPVA